jgi:surfeit locus 1 family protein
MLFCLLGVWQLHRYHEKEALLSRYHSRLHASPRPFVEQIHSADLEFQPVTVEGSYLNALTFLLQNRFYHDQLGFEVLTPFHVLGEKKVLLVDRGWIPRSHPPIEPVKGIQKISGYLKLLDRQTFILGKNILYPNVHPMVIQKIEIKDLEKVTQYSFFSLILRLNPSEPQGFIREWTMTVVPPERHMAYAVQWFLMAIVLCVAYFSFSCERKKEGEQT